MPAVTASHWDGNTPEIFPHMSAASVASLLEEVDIRIHPHTMFWYPINVSIFLFCLWAIALSLHDCVLPSRIFTGRRWHAREGHKRAMVVYLLSILVTTISLVLQIVSSGVFRLDYKVAYMNMIRAAGTLITILYLFEMIYREKMRFAMLCHHCLTIFAIGFLMVLMDKTQDPSFVITGSLWLFQATTGQLTFVALFGYRLEWSPRVLRPILRIAAVQALVVKLVSIVACIYVWFKYQRASQIAPKYSRAWDAVIWMAALSLMATQFWGSWVVWAMGASLERTYEQKLQARSVRTETQMPAQNTESVLNARAPRSEVMVTPALSLQDSFGSCTSLYYNSNDEDGIVLESTDKLRTSHQGCEASQEKS